jgi:sirohydrochlorin cobaltochelatase
MSFDAVILVGHGGVPSDFPPARLSRLKQLEGARRRAKGDSSGELGAEEAELDRELRSWPRTPRTDPYQAGLERIAEALRPLFGATTICLAYNEFCAPSLDEAVRELTARGFRRIGIVTTMFTPGGSHSEIEIPEILAACRMRHPGVELEYLWPFDVARIARFVADHVEALEHQKAAPRST